MTTKFAPRTRQQGIASALASVTNKPRFCAQWTRERFGVGALGDFDGDGAADAEDMWKAAQSKHPGDRHPPAGVPVFWGGGSSDNGHAGVTLPGGQVEVFRSTDGAGAGRVATVPLDFPERQWGMPYLGWSDDLYGYFIVDEERVRLEGWRARLRAKRKRTSAKLAMIRKSLAARK